jgi:acyl carrier protein
MSDSITNDVLDIIANYVEDDTNDKELSPDDALDDIGVDSLAIAEIVFDLEDKFDIDIPDPYDIQERMEQFKTIQNVIDSVEQLIAEKK